MTQAILFGFTVLLVVAAVGDWRRYLIPNWISLAILALYPPFVLSSNLLGPTSAQVPWLASVGVATIVFIILAGLFALNKLGGGDVKMISAVSLWAGPGLIAGFFLTTSLAGGVLVLASLARARLKKQRDFRNLTSDEDRPYTENSEEEDGATEGGKTPSLQIPYGVAIACGGIFVSGKHIINQFSQ